MQTFMHPNNIKMTNTEQNKPDSFSINKFLISSINLSAALLTIHNNGQIHKAVCPSLIRIDKKTNKIKLEECRYFLENGKLMDNSDPSSPVFIVLKESKLNKDILPFISPEQTGRTGWPLDFHSDIYSLGIILYQWATGLNPFHADDPMGFFHCQIAAEPELPENINPQLPTQISNIIIKLLEKSPENRYQSVTGLKKDLEKCLAILNTSKRIESFLLGECDLAYRPGKNFFGRSLELNILLQWLELVKQGHGKMALVAGYSGIGKTSLVKEFIRLSFFEQSKGSTLRFISGKFDSLDQNRPYHALITALQQMAKQILSQDNKTLAFWKARLKKTMTLHGHIILDMIPELGSITEPLPKLSQVTPQDAQIQFEISLHHFFKTMCTREHPVIIFLDDLQWADPGTIRLLKTLKQEKIPWLFIVGAFRNNEVSSRHPLHFFLSELQKDNEIITLDPLDSKTISKMIIDATRMKNKDALPLAKTIKNKTQGNPFFIIDFLNSLYTNKLLFLNSQNSAWHFDIKKIETLNITENTATHIKEQIITLTDNQKNIMNIASCITVQFSENFLSKICPGSKKEMLMDLAFLASQNLLINNKGSWRVSHDKIKDYLYFSMNENEQQQLHYTIGNALLCKKPLNSMVFEILQHLNNCIDLISSKNEKIQLAALNLQAVLISKGQGAFESAFYFAQKGLYLLPPDTWTAETQLTLDLHFAIGETGYFTDNKEAADETILKIIKNISSLEDRVKAYEIMISNLILSGHAKKATLLGVEALNMLGMKLPEKVTSWIIIKEYILTRLHLIGRDPATLTHLPKLTDPKKIMIVRIFFGFFDASYLGAHEYTPLIVLKILIITLKYGETALSGYAYALYGAVLCEKFGKYNEGLKFGKLALKFHEQPHTIRTKSRTYLIFGGMINYWKNHLKTDFPYLMEAVKSGKENGNDFMFASLALNQYLSQLIISGDSLPKVGKTFKKYNNFIKTTRPLPFASIYYLFYQGVLTLMGKTDDPKIIRGELFNETIAFPKLKKDDDPSLRGLYLLQVVIGYFYYDFQKALKAAEACIKTLNPSIGVLIGPYISFFQSLSMLALYPEMDKKKQKSYLAQVKKKLKKFKRISKHSPENFFSMYVLIQAETAGLKGQKEKASTLYQQAIISAEENGFTHLEAIANECAAKYFLKRKQNTIAAAYMRQAHECFTRWGAKPKIKHLETLYPDLLAQPEGKSPSSPTVKAPGLISIIKASRAIAEEGDIQKLMDKLMNIIIENAGARTGVLILLQDGLPMVEASVSANHAVQTRFSPVPVEECLYLPDSIINYVIRTKQTLILSNAVNKGLYTENMYIKTKKIKSIICIPMIHEGQSIGALYLENSKATNVFTQKRVSILKMVTDIMTNAWSRKKAQNDLMIYQEKLRALSSKTALSEEKERRNIALGLHDRIGQSLTLTRIKLGELNHGASSKTTKEKLKSIIAIMDQTIDQTRSLTFDLSAPELYDLGIEAALDSLCERKSQLYDIPIKFFDEEKPKPLDEASRILLYQASRELLFNIIKHAHAKTILVTIKRIDDSIQIIIEDDGAGFDTDQIRSSKKTMDGYGLFSIKERMNHHNGSFSIESRPGHGTKAILMTPLKVF